MRLFHLPLPPPPAPPILLELAYGDPLPAVASHGDKQLPPQVLDNSSYKAFWECELGALSMARACRCLFFFYFFPYISTLL